MSVLHGGSIHVSFAVARSVWQEDASAYLNRQPLRPSHERNVFSLLRDGHGHQEIAEKLHIARSTLKTHVRSILQKAGCTNGRELLARLLSS